MNIVFSPAFFVYAELWEVVGQRQNAKDDVFPDNVLIKGIKDENGISFKPDGIARELHLYKTKPDYSDCHGKYSLCGCNVILIEAMTAPKFKCKKRVRIKEDNKLNFELVETE